GLGKSRLAPTIPVQTLVACLDGGRGMRIVAVVLLLALAGCATPYQNMGFMGGVEAQQMTADPYRIVARGNGYTGSTTIQDYTLLKAAETTRQAGGTHFSIISASDASRAGTIVTPGQAQTSVVGNTGDRLALIAW